MMENLPIILAVLGVGLIGFILGAAIFAGKKDKKASKEIKNSQNNERELEQQLDINSKNIQEVEKALTSICEGNLSFSLDASQKKNNGILQSCDKMFTRIRNLISKIMRLAVILSSASSKWSKATSELNQITSEHAQAIQKLLADNKSIVASVAKSQKIIKKIQEEEIEQGQEGMEEQEAKMAENLELMVNLTEEVANLEKLTDNITVITETINDLAEETNLLALNASIEAARAGGQGHSFNVIAQEIKSLAEDSMSSSSDIIKLVSSIQNGILTVVDSVRNAKEGVKTQEETLQNLSQVFARIVDSSNDIADKLTEVDNLTTISLTKTQELNEGLQKQAESVDYIEKQADRLARVSQELLDEMDQFEFIKLAYTEVEATSAYVAKNLLEKKLEQSVVLVPLNYAEMYHAISDKILDGMVSAWLPKTHEKYQQEFAQHFVDLGANLKGARVGLVVPSYVEIDSISELKGQSGQFFQQKIHAIGPTAGVTLAAQEALEDYKLNNWRVDAMGLEKMLINLEKAIARREPIVITGWKPHWMFEKFSLEFLGDSKRTFGGAEEIHTITRTDLRQEKPEVFKLLQSIKFDMDEYTKMMWQVTQGEDIGQITSNYVEENL